MKNELAPLPRTAPERLAAFRHAFNELIAMLPAHGPLLAEVKREYEVALQRSDSGSSAAELGVPSVPLQALHPLQMPAAFYEARWKHCENELALVKAQRQRLRRMVKQLRGGCTEASARVRGAGAEAGVATGGGATGPKRWSSGEEAGAPADEDEEDEDEGEFGITDPDRALAASKRVVNEAMERATEREVASLREDVELLELRVLGAGRLAMRLKQATLAQRLQLEDEMGKAAAEAEASPSEESTHRAAALGVLLKMARGQEEQIQAAEKLLREPQGIDRATLRKIVAGS